MFKLNIKSSNKKIIYKPLSISIKYLIDDKKLAKNLKDLERIFNIKLTELQKKNFLAEDGTEIRVSKPVGKPDALVIHKVKLNSKFNSDYFRNQLAGFIKKLEKEEIKDLHIFIPNYKPFKKYFDSEAYFSRTFIEGIMLGNYKFDKFKSSKKPDKKLNVLLHGENNKLVNSAISKTNVVMEGVNFAKDLQNEPASSLRPSDLAKRVKQKLTEAGVKVTVFDEKEIKKRKMGGLLAVGDRKSVV